MHKCNYDLTKKGAVVIKTIAPFDMGILQCYNGGSERMINYGKRKMDGPQ